MIHLLLAHALAGESGFLGLAAVMPADVSDVTLVAEVSNSPPVLFVDDGSLGMDNPRDGEWWALVKPQGLTTPVVISGVVDGAPVAMDLEIATPRVWDSPVYVTTFRVDEGPDGWALQRILTPPMIDRATQKRTGAGLADQSWATGWSARGLYALWGVFVLALVCTAVLRSALRAQGSDGTR